MPHSSRPRAWTVAALAAGGAAGFLFVTSAINSHGVDLRGSSVTDLTTLLISERNHVRDLQAQVAAANEDITALTVSTHDSRISNLKPKIDLLREQAGFTELSGPGVTVTLDDAPKDIINKAQRGGDVPVDALLVHQQDIQGVINALWQGGAVGISIQGQRVISTTGIKCVGNTVVLHGVPYSPPYVIRAVGSIARMTAAINASEYVQAYKSFVPTYHLGWDFVPEKETEVPAYTGTSDLTATSSD